MKVLIVIGIIAFFAGLAWIVMDLNIYTEKNYKKKFITWEYFLGYFVMFILTYYGIDWYMDAKKIDGDILNGILLIFFAILLFISIVIINIKAVGLKIGLFITLVQLIIYIPLTVAGIVVLLIAMAFFSQTKPVYNINNK